MRQFKRFSCMAVMCLAAILLASTPGKTLGAPKLLVVGPAEDNLLPSWPGWSQVDVVNSTQFLAMSVSDLQEYAVIELDHPDANIGSAAGATQVLAALQSGISIYSFSSNNPNISFAPGSVSPSGQDSCTELGAIVAPAHPIITFPNPNITVSDLAPVGCGLHGSFVNVSSDYTVLATSGTTGNPVMLASTSFGPGNVFLSSHHFHGIGNLGSVRFRDAVVMFLLATVDTDGDTVFDGFDNCLNTPNPDQADANGDGSGDACQPTVDIVSIASNGTNLLGEIDIFDPSGDPLSGVVQVIDTPGAPVSVTMESLNTCDFDTIELRLNGVPIGSIPGADGGQHCTCNPPDVDTLVISNGVIAANFNLPPGTNTLSVNKVNTSTALAWVKAILEYSDGTSQEVCVFDQPGGVANCQERVNLCSAGFTSSAVSATSPPVVGPGQVVVSASYNNSELPAFLDVSGLAPGPYFLRATTTDVSTPEVVDHAPFTLAGEPLIAVNNVAPTVAADTASVTVDEGQTATNSGTFGDADADTVGLTASVGTVIDNGNGTWSWSFDTTDGPNESQTVTITAQDEYGGSNQTTFSLTVSNVVPTVNAGADQTANEGDTVNLSGSFTDPGSADTHTIAWSFGDGGTASGTLTPTHTYADNGTYTVTLTVTDDDGGSTSDTLSVSVINVAPTVAADNTTVAVNEGATTGNTGTFGDPGTDVVTLSASRGTVTATAGGIWSWSFATTDGPADSGSVTITATDSDGAFTTTTFTLTVNNVAPTVAAANTTVAVNEGQTATNSGTFADVPADTVSLSASVGTLTPNSGTWSWSFNTTDGSAESQTVTIIAQDEDGGSNQTTFTLTVTNVAPTVNAGADQTADEGDTVSLSGNFTDPGSADTHTIAWTFGDGGTASGTLSPTHTYTDNGTYTVTLTVTDDDGGVTSDTLSVTITNVAPTVTVPIVSPSPSDEGSTVFASATFSDPGANDTPFSCTVDHGDGTGPQPGTISGTTCEGSSRTYGDNGTYTVTVAVTDKDGGMGSNSTSHTVTNVAPTVAADNASVTVDEGQTATNSGIFADVPADTVSLSASVGTLTPNSGTWSWSFDTTDGPSESQTVTITAQDEDGGSNETTFALTVNNVAPSVTTPIVSPSSSEEGQAVVASATFNDPGVSDTPFSCTVDYGDGTGPVAGTVSGTTCEGSSHTYGDSGTYTVTVAVTDKDEDMGSNATSHTVNNVAPTMVADLAGQDIQYSDRLAAVTITATDVAADSFAAETHWNKDGGAFTPGLPDSLTLSAADCSGSDSTQTICSWTLSGVFELAEGNYTIQVTVTDDDLGETDFDIMIMVFAEDATVAFEGNNPVAVPVAAPGGNSGSFSLTVYVQETYPDLPDDGSEAPGDISLAVVSMQLIPVGPGSPISGVCTPDGTTDSGYDAVLTVSCSFDNVPVNTYTMETTVDVDGYYTGFGEDVVVVFDPSLGFATGGGWFYWPGTDEPYIDYPGDRTNFGFTMKYNKKGTNVQGNLLLIRHLPDGTIYRVKSNAISGLAVGEDLDGEPFGWASFSGKATYLDPSMLEPEGNYGFTTYVEDHNDPGTGLDRVWIELQDKSGYVMNSLSLGRPGVANAVQIEGGNIAVPHSSQSASTN